MTPKAQLIQTAGSLFEDVQLKRIFSDSMTFVDCEPLREPALILADYEKEKSHNTFNLETFIKQNFKIPQPAGYSTVAKHDNYQSLADYIEHMWTALSRQPTSHSALSSLLPLPYPYIVPGGRFREMYYWDSYFTALGLIGTEYEKIVVDMCRNYSYLIDTYGFIPNGTRSYFLTRSQPPFFVLLIDLILKYIDSKLLTEFLPRLEKEYQYWMVGEDKVKRPGELYQHVVRMPGGELANRYYDSEDTPREEAYYEDFHAAAVLPDSERVAYYQSIRAGAESGWDYSSRWLADLKSLTTIQTASIAPVDLNCMMYLMEKKLAEWYGIVGDVRKSIHYVIRANKRAEMIKKYFWSWQDHFYFDFNLETKTHTKAWSLAAMFPLFVKLAASVQAAEVIKQLHNKFLYSGGLVTTLHESGQQWDYPNGWAPLQWIAAEALDNYKAHELSLVVRSRWIRLCEHVFRLTGTIYEKYNVVNSYIPSTSGEYSVQTGFGWTNGVVADFMRRVSTKK